MLLLMVVRYIRANKLPIGIMSSEQRPMLANRVRITPFALMTIWALIFNVTSFSLFGVGSSLDSRVDNDNTNEHKSTVMIRQNGANDRGTSSTSLQDLQMMLFYHQDDENGTFGQRRRRRSNKTRRHAINLMQQQSQQQHRDTSLNSNNNNSLMPEFSQPIGNISAVLGRDVRLVCTVDNLGPYQVAWLKEETRTILSIDTNIIITNYRIFLIPDEEGRKWVLHIKDVQESDRGFYQCQVNTQPMRSTSGYLEVVVPPTIVEAQTSQTADVIEQANVSIQCKANGHPKPTITWRREDGQPIRLIGAKTRIESLVRNSRQRTSQNTGQTLDSIVKGTILDANNNNYNNQVHSEAGSIVSQLDDVKSDKLTLIDVDRSMAGLYVCSASNGIPGPQANKRIPLYVRFAPKVSVQNKYISVSEGDQLEVDCLIEAHPKADSYWAKQNNNNKPRNNIGLQPLHDHLQQLVARRTPRGASSAFGPNLANGATLLQAGDTQIEPGCEQLNCLPPDGSTDVDVKLTKVLDKVMFVNKSTPIIMSRRTKRQSYHQQASLSDDDTIETSSGSVEVEHVNSNQVDSFFDADNSDEAQMTTFADHPHEQQQQQQHLSLGHKKPQQGQQMTIKQTPINAYTWQLKLIIKQMGPSDFGEYSCVASNPMGQSEAVIHVTRADKLPAATNKDQTTLVKTIDHGDIWTGSTAQTIVQSNELDLYQRDSLIVTEPANGNNQHLANDLANIHQQQRVAAAPGSSNGRSRGSSMSNNPASLPTSSGSSQYHRVVVYDENYLQAIKNRGQAASNQANGNNQANRLQQKLRMRQSDSRNSSVSTKKLARIEVILVLLFLACKFIAINIRSISITIDHG